MDATEADQDVKLQKISKDLLTELGDGLTTFLRKPDGRGGTTPRSRVRSHELFRLTSHVLDPFQELPQLLDPYLPKWIPFLSETYLELLLHARPESAGQRADPSKHLVSAEYAICKLLYTFCKIRGEKVIVRFLNVEARYLELLTSAIENAEETADGSEESDNSWAWEQRYIVLLWISHLLLAPFDLSTISSVDPEDMSIPSIPHLSWPKGLPGIALRVLPLGVKYLASPGRERDAAKALMVRISMRRDMQQLGLLDCLVSWALDSLKPKEDDADTTPYFYLGVLSFLAGALRSSSDTSDMDKHLQVIFHTVHSVSIDDSTSSKSIVSLALARKMILKVMRAVVVSLLRQPEQTDASTELTETAIGHLLESVADNDTPVRLLASKSLSIITLKLDPFMASQVVEAVLDSLNRNVLWSKPSAASGAKPTRDLSAVNSLEWHGLMLTLSHLLYRRSPPAAQLSDIVHALLLGLSFEQRSTSGGSVGSNVRDAACFGIWAVARRYTTEELLAVSTKSVFAARAHNPTSSVLQVLATELVTTACLDPAGNIRRGASAALQELIGRHPNTIEEGIGVVQAVDYHAVARRSRALAEVAHGAAELSAQYGEAVVDGILGWRGIGDVDAGSRRDAARGYGKLVAELAVGSEDSTSRVKRAIRDVDDRLKLLARRQVEERHGLLLCYAAVIDQIPTLMKGNRKNELLDEREVSKIIESVTDILRECGEVTYRKPDLIAEGVSRLVVSLVPLLTAVAFNDYRREMPKLSLYLTEQAGVYTDVIAAVDRRHQEGSDSLLAAFTSALHKAIPAWLARDEQFLLEPVSEAAVTLLVFSASEQRDLTTREWTDAIRRKPTSRNSGIGDGYMHALALAEFLLFDQQSIGDAFLQRWADDNDVETRVAILQSLTRSRLLRNDMVKLLPLLNDGLNDYTTNARGDIGSHVRVQALRVVQSLWADRNFDEAWSGSTLSVLYGNVLRLAAEKLDRVRPEAQAALALTLKEEHQAAFQELTFSSELYLRTLLSFLESNEKFHPKIQQHIHSDLGMLTAHLLAGYVTSADTGNEDLVIASRAALCNFISSAADPAHSSFLIGTALLHNLRTNQGNDRVIIPTLEIIAFLFRVGLLSQGSDVSEKGNTSEQQQQRSPEQLDLKAICVQTQKAGYKSGSVRKIEACVRVYGGIAAAGQEIASQEARKRLGALLFHPWPKVRSMVVDEVWGLLGEGGGNGGEGLLSVDWGRASKTQIRGIVEELGLV
ncbi:hypothetical protein NLU13_0668 [Sarocladium strictum]|uniref:Tubulin-specific chaperone D C-terminal domain-containing protein n=1 Tax=Sarocladium strictum TaxID=5046 RepID=A0AA39GS93_SARSR|nr:hypothetical protein NLU13_0668 [Sarocladium strictum]